MRHERWRERGKIKPVKRLFRHLRTAAVWLSLLLCVAPIGCWARGYWGEDVLSWVGRPKPGTESPGFTLASSGGGLACYWGSYTPGVVPKILPAGWEWIV